MIHDGYINGIEVVCSGIEGVAWAVSDDKTALLSLHEQGLSDEPTVGGTVSWVSRLTDDGLRLVQETGRGDE